MKVQEGITHTFHCPQSNEHIQGTECETMYRSFVTTPIISHYLLLFVTNMFNTLLRLDIYKWQDVRITTQRPTIMWSSSLLSHPYEVHDRVLYDDAKMTSNMASFLSNVMK